MDQDVSFQDQLRQGYGIDRVLGDIIDRLKNNDQQLAQRYHWDSENQRLYLKDERTCKIHFSL